MIHIQFKDVDKEIESKESDVSLAGYPVKGDWVQHLPKQCRLASMASLPWFRAPMLLSSSLA
jgi:hypothetical protein